MSGRIVVVDMMGSVVVIVASGVVASGVVLAGVVVGAGGLSSIYQILSWSRSPNPTREADPPKK